MEDEAFEQLRSIFPEEDPKRLSAALTASLFNVEAAANSLIGNSSSEPFSDEAAVLQDIFPTSGRGAILDALKRCEGNVHAASECLLAMSLTESTDITMDGQPRAEDADNVDNELLGILLTNHSSHTGNLPTNLSCSEQHPSNSRAGQETETARRREYRPPSSTLHRHCPETSIVQNETDEKAMSNSQDHGSDAAAIDAFHIVQRRQPRTCDSPGGDNASTQAEFRLVVLVGLPGSGKSTLARRFAARGWRVVCQDELGSRAACEEAAAGALREGARVVVDRTNIDAEQRAHWLRLARQHRLPDSAAACVVLSAPRAECERRVLARRGHPTLPPDASSVGVVRRFAAQYQAPSPQEGFGRVLVAGRGGRDSAALEALLRE